MRRVSITDVTLRDSIGEFTTNYLHTQEVVEVARMLDRAGFASIDFWGGTTFYACIKNLREDPWERLKLVRRVVKNTPLQMLVRGQFAVGLRPYPRDVLTALMRKAADCGIDVFKVTDLLNNVKSLEMPITIAKELHRRVEATIIHSYNPAYSEEMYLDLADKLLRMGADVICLNDPFGIMTPVQTEILVRLFKKRFHQPLRLHLHNNNRMALACYQEAVKAGADIVDTAISTMAWEYSPPPVEPLVVALRGTDFDTGMDMGVLAEVSEYFSRLKARYGYEIKAEYGVDHHSLTSYLPGILRRFILDELRGEGIADRFPQALAEVELVWKELGYPPLISPLMEIIGLQAIANVLDGKRYARILENTHNYIVGYYGQPPFMVDEAIQKRVLGSGRPVYSGMGELIGPSMEEVERSKAHELTTEEDRITYALFPELAEDFFRLRDRPKAMETAKKVTSITKELFAMEHRFKDRGVLERLMDRICINLQGETAEVVLEGINPLKEGKRTLFLRIGDRLEEVEVSLSDSGAMEVSLHGDRYRAQIREHLPKGRRFTPLIMEVNGRAEEVLVEYL